MITSVIAPVDLQAKIARPTLMTVKAIPVSMEEYVMMEFKVILVFVKLDSLEKTVKWQSMSANHHLVFMEHAQICLTTTNALVMLDILEEIVQW